MSNVEVVVEEEPPAGMPLLGLYQGVPLTHAAPSTPAPCRTRSRSSAGPWSDCTGTIRSACGARSGASCCTRSRTTSGSATSGSSSSTATDAERKAHACQPFHAGVRRDPGARLRRRRRGGRLALRDVRLHRALASRKPPRAARDRRLSSGDHARAALAARTSWCASTTWTRTTSGRASGAPRSSAHPRTTRTARGSTPPSTSADTRGRSRSRSPTSRRRTGAARPALAL